MRIKRPYEITRKLFLFPEERPGLFAISSDGVEVVRSPFLTPRGYRIYIINLPSFYVSGGGRSGKGKHLTSKYRRMDRSLDTFLSWYRATISKIEVADTEQEFKQAA